MVSNKQNRTLYGVDNEVYLIGRKDNPEAVLKSYTKKSFKEVRQIYDLQKELLIKKIPVPVPYELGDKVRPFILMSYISGSHSENLSQKETSEVATAMAKFNNLTVKVKLKNYKFTKRQFNELVSKCLKWNKAKIISNILDKIDFAYLKSLKTGLIHGDFSQSNLLFNKKGGLEGLLDIDHSCLSYRLSDITRFMAFLAFDSNNQLRIKKISDFVTMYERKIKLPQIERNYFFIHMQLHLIKMTLETYYYVKVLKKVSPDLFKRSMNLSFESLLQRLMQIQSLTSLHD